MVVWKKRKKTNILIFIHAMAGGSTVVVFEQDVGSKRSGGIWYAKFINTEES